MDLIVFLPFWQLPLTQNDANGVSRDVSAVLRAATRFARAARKAAKTRSADKYIRETSLLDSEP
jgi:hypothetical protein